MFCFVFFFVFCGTEVPACQMVSLTVITIITALLSGFAPVMSGYVPFMQVPEHAFYVYYACSCISSGSEPGFASCKAFSIISRYMNNCIHDGKCLMNAVDRNQNNRDRTGYGRSMRIYILYSLTKI